MNVPTSAEPIMPPRISGGSEIAPMVLITPSTAATMPSAGSASAMVCKRGRGVQRLVMVLFELLFHRRFDLMRIFQAHRHHAQRVADEGEREMILGDARIAFEDRAVFGLFDMRFERDQALGFHRLGQEIEQAQKVGIVRMLPFRAGNDLAHLAAHLLERIERAADQRGRDGRAADGDHFVRQGLEHDAERAARQDVAAEHGHEQKDKTADLKHANA